MISRLVRSEVGRILEASRQNERRHSHRLAAFALSGAITGFAGALMCNSLRYVGADMLHSSKSGELMVMAALGGIGTLAGPLAGAALFVVLEALLKPLSEHWQLALGALLLAIVLYTRGGIVGLAVILTGRRQ